MGENDILTFLWFGQITGFEWLSLIENSRSLGALECENDLICDAGSQKKLICIETI